MYKVKSGLAIHWFRQDLRLSDNPAFHAACQHKTVLPLYIWDTHHPGPQAMGAASRWWLYHSLRSLKDSLDQHLSFTQGDPLTILLDLVASFDIEAVYWNRGYEPWQIRRDTQIKQRLESQNVHVKSHPAFLLWEPWQIHKQDGTPYKVFTPFYRKGCLSAAEPRAPLDPPLRPRLQKLQGSISLDHLGLLPLIRWDKKMETLWRKGEKGAQETLEIFMQNGIDHYKEGRNLPSQSYVSRLSPYLHFGEISPHQIWQRLSQRPTDSNSEHFLSELGWREFSYHLLYHQPDLPEKNIKKTFDEFPWCDHPKHLQAWQAGQTGIPMVDAGMRELWHTGYMHNRVRMIVGSFLVKNLRIHWREGAKWFWDTLVDADLANNSASWQWIAGCGADAAPYFRIFNPVTQGKTFDPQGLYVKKWIPELASIPLKFMMQPWRAPSHVLEKAGVILGKTYPDPIVDLATSRQQALESFFDLRS